MDVPGVILKLDLESVWMKRLPRMQIRVIGSPVPCHPVWEMQ